MSHLKMYLRVSTIDQANSGLGRTAQYNGCLKEGNRIGGDWSFDCFGPIDKPGVFCDDGESAYSIPFYKRPAGKALLASLNKGDTVIVLRLDRLCRNMQDFCALMHQFKKLDVSLVSISPPINLKTANGRARAKFYILFAEWESEIKGERIKDALAMKKFMSQAAKITSEEKLENLPSEYRPEKSPIGEKPAATGRIFPYTRCSHRSSVESGLGIREQIYRNDEFCIKLQEANPSLTIGEPYVELAVSSLSNPLRSRPVGGMMFKELKPGDHVVFYRPDRVFGTVRDMVNTVHDWVEQGITAHFSEDGTNTEDESGVFLLTMATLFSQLERQLASSRNKEARAVLESAGKFAGGRNAPTFWKVYKNRQFKRLVLDRQQLVEYRYLRLAMKRYGLNINKACVRLESLKAVREGRREIPQSGASVSLPGFNQIKDRPVVKGMIFPSWTEWRFRLAKSKYEKALDDWRNMKLEAKRAVRAMKGR